MLNLNYPSKKENEVWQWRIPFKTTTVDFDEQIDKTAISEKLDLCFQEILEFESDLANKLGY